MKSRMEEMNICVSVNAKYSKYLCVMLRSLIDHNQENKINIYVLNTDLGDTEKKWIINTTNSSNVEIKFIWINPEDFSEYTKTLTERYSIEAFFRFKIPQVMPDNIDRVLYLDVDILVQGSLDKFYDNDFEGNLFCACQDMFVGMDRRRIELFNRTDKRYFNSGVMLWNLQELRKKDFYSECFEGARALKFDLPCVDQEVLNYLYYDKVKYVESQKYNYLVNKDVVYGTDYRKSSPIILHYAGHNPWAIGAKSEAYLEWWKVAKTTPFYQELLEEQLLRTEKFLAQENVKRRSASNMGEDRVSELASVIRELFECELKNKKVFLFGAGLGMRVFLSQYADKCDIAGIVDNDTKIENSLIKDFAANEYVGEADQIVITNPRYLLEVDWNKTVLVITVKKADEIKKQLREMGITKYYCLSDMYTKNWKTILSDVV